LVIQITHFKLQICWTDSKLKYSDRTHKTHKHTHTHTRPHDSGTVKIDQRETVEAQGEDGR